MQRAQNGLGQRQSFFWSKQRTLVRIDTDPDSNPIKNLGSSTDNIDVPQRQGVETSNIDRVMRTQSFRHRKVSPVNERIVTMRFVSMRTRELRRTAHGVCLLRIANSFPPMNIRFRTQFAGLPEEIVASVSSVDVEFGWVGSGSIIDIVIQRPLRNLVKKTKPRTITYTEHQTQLQNKLG